MGERGLGDRKGIRGRGGDPWLMGGRRRAFGGLVVGFGGLILCCE